jgi:hypothetical protein
MNEIIKIPSNVRYISEIIKTLPTGLLNKGKVGAGLTTLVLTNHENYIITVPYVNLIENKVRQNPNVLGVYGGNKDKQIIKNYLISDILPKKLMVTYDSFSWLLDTIEELNVNLKEYKILIDEYHTLFTQYGFRTKAIQNVLQNYKRGKDYTFITATPVEDEFKLEELKHLPVTVYEWEDNVDIEIQSIKCQSSVLNTTANIIQRFLENSIEGNAYIFVNSIKYIEKLIKICKLNNNNCRIIYSKNSTKKLSISNGNVLDDPKKINILTSTVWEGADIYDENGKTFIISDPETEHTLVDISTSFQQIVGRLRNTKYWNTIHHIYTENEYSKYSYSDFKNQIKIYEERSRRVATHLNLLSNEDRQMLEAKDRYIIKGEEDEDFAFIFEPNLIKLDLYQYKLVNCVYRLSANIQKEYQKYNYNYILKENESEEIYYVEDIPKNFKDCVIKLKEFYPKDLYTATEKHLRDDIFSRYSYLKEAIDTLGYEFIEKTNYICSNIKKKLITSNPYEENTDKIKKLLLSDYRISCNKFIYTDQLKQLLQTIYDSLKMKKKATSTDIETYFVVKTVKCMDKKTNKRKNGYRIYL